MCSGWQVGGGLNIVGTATLTNTNVYSNEATGVCSPFSTVFELSSIAPMERYVLDFWLLQGGGLNIEGTATLTNTNVYSNTASGVRSLSALA